MVRKQETKEVVIVKETPLEVSQEKVNRWGTAPQLSKRDLLISKILPMQPMSKKVTAGEAAFGELRDSLSNACLGSFNKPLQILPFHWQNVWVESDWSEEDDEYKYARIVPITPKNEDLPYEEEGKVKRVYTINVFVVLPHELKDDPNAFPRIVSFRVTSLRNGRKLLTQMAQGIAGGKGPAAFHYLLMVKKESNDKGTYAVLDIERREASSEEEQDAAFRWFETIGANKVKVDDSDITEGESGATENTTQSAPASTGRF